MLKILCDKCGCEILEGGFAVFDMESLMCGNQNLYNAKYICRKCAGKVFAASEQKEETDELKDEDKKETDEEAAETKSKRRRKIDIGKIMALYNAKWKVKDIAGEMGMEPQAVSQAIFQYKKKIGMISKEKVGSTSLK